MTARPLKVALFGSPAFALPTLEVLLESHEVALVVTQPDRRAGRGMRTQAPAVARRARELGLPLEQPTKLRNNEEFKARLAALEIDVAVTAAYGRILPAEVLAVPRHGFLNVHASLLPAYRGAAPVQWALINGERKTGVTIMQTDVGLDTGPVRLQVETSVKDDEHAGALLERLSHLGADALGEALSLLQAGELPLVPQEDAAATLAPPLAPEDGRIRWHEGAGAIHDRYRGVWLWPGSFFEHAGERVKVEELSLQLTPSEHTEAPGTVLEVHEDGVTVAAASGAVRLKSLKPAGRRAMRARDWANGRQVRKGTRLG